MLFKIEKKHSRIALELILIFFQRAKEFFNFKNEKAEISEEQNIFISTFILVCMLIIVREISVDTPYKITVQTFNQITTPIVQQVQNIQEFRAERARQRELDRLGAIILEFENKEFEGVLNIPESDFSPAREQEIIQVLTIQNEQVSGVQYTKGNQTRNQNFTERLIGEYDPSERTLVMDLVVEGGILRYTGEVIFESKDKIREIVGTAEVTESMIPQSNQEKIDFILKPVN